MKKIFAIALGLLSLVLVTVQTTLAQTKGLLWQITGKNIKEPTYLYGTIHLYDTSMYQLPKPVLNKLSQTKQVYFELDFGKINPMDMMKYALVKDSTERLDKMLDAASLQKFREIAKSSSMLQMMGENMYRLKPIFLTTMLLNNGKSVAIDMEIYNRAKELKDSVGGIETVDEQMAAINALPAASQVRMVKEMLKTYTTADDAIKKLTSIYVKQEINSLLSEMNDGAPMDAAFNEALLNKRNIVMANRIDLLVGKTSTMIAVGAGHLGGPQGVIALLKKKGYQFKSVPFVFTKAH